MAFFSKLKSRLFKSSAKINEGLDALMEGGEEEPVGPDLPPRPGPAEIPGPPDETPSPPREAPDLPDETPPSPPGPDVPMPEPEPNPPGPDVPAPEPTRPEPDVPQEQPEPPREQPPSAPPGIPPGSPPELSQEDASRPAARRGFFARVFLGDEPGGAPAPAPAEPRFEKKRVLDDALLESLEELLISADLGVDASLRVSAALAEGRSGRKVGASEIKGMLAQEVARILEPVARPLPLTGQKPQVVLVVGVNGSGKTTTIGKLASQLRGAGKKVVIAAGDTFRAAAVEQLQVWGERAGVPVLTAPQGSDPASLAFDALEKAQADGADLLMIDTAGRLQNRADLMSELEKIVRVLRKKDPTAPHNTLLVLDATVGQNALSQVELFQKAADVSGLVMTKLDGTAKGGVLVALAHRFGLPIHAIGVGESIDDLAPFDPDDFARALTGAEA